MAEMEVKTPLIQALQMLDLCSDVDLAGRWVKLQGERCAVYIVELAWDAGYYTWCDHPLARTVEKYSDPHMAIEAGLRRARHHAQTVDDP